MKETTELLTAIFKTVNSIKLAMADKKIDVNDLQYLLPLIFTWQEGVKDLTFAQEARTATPEQIDQAFAAAGKELTAYPDAFRYALITSVKGYYTTYWMASREGFEAGQRSVSVGEAKR